MFALLSHTEKALWGGGGWDAGGDGGGGAVPCCACEAFAAYTCSVQNSRPLFAMTKVEKRCIPTVVI